MVAISIPKIKARFGARLRRELSARTWEQRIDGFWGVVSPKRAFLRQQAREAMAVHDGAFVGGASQLDGETWVTSSGSADEDLLPKLPKLRERSRELNQNDPHAASIKLAFVDNVVGTGIRPKPKPDRKRLRDAGVTDKEIDQFIEQAEAIWEAQVPHFDYAARLDHYEQQRQVEAKLCEDGEAFGIIRMVSSPKRAFRPYEIAVQMIEADRVATPVKLPKQLRPFVRAGIHVERGSGRPLNVYVRNTHPGDRRYADQRKDAINYRPIPLRNKDGRHGILHVFHQDRPELTRGVPVLTPILPHLKLFKDTLRAEAMSVKVQALFSCFITKKDPVSYALSRSTKRDDGEREGKLFPGMKEILQPGESVEFGDPTRPGNTFEMWAFRMLKVMGAGVGLSYEHVSRDYTKTTYTSGRMSDLTTRRTFICRRSKVVSGFSKPCRDMLLEEAWMKGDLVAPKWDELKDAWCAAEWRGDGWKMVDPVKDMQGHKLAMELEIRSRRSIVAELGEDPDEVFRDNARDKAAKDEIVGPQPALPVAPVPGAPAPEDGPAVTDNTESQTGNEDMPVEDKQPAEVGT